MLKLFVLIELIRKIEGFEFITQFMKTFLDERDDGLFFRSHIYFLLGCLVPIIGSIIDSRFDPYIGVISLGI